MKFDPNIHHRRSIRLKGYDYTQPGAYFITLVTYQRNEIFGDVVNGAMKLSPLGKIVRDEWMRSMGIRQEIRLHDDELGIMPNHLHAIIWIIDPTIVVAWHAPSRPNLNPNRNSKSQSASCTSSPRKRGRTPCAPTDAGAQIIGSFHRRV